MQLIFTKGDGKFDRLEMKRDGHDLATITCRKQGIRKNREAIAHPKRG